MSFKSQTTKDSIEHIKDKKKQAKKETEMSNKKTVIVSVAVTLAVVATLAAIFYAGTQYQVHLNDQIVSARTEALASLKSKQ